MKGVFLDEGSLHHGDLDLAALHALGEWRFYDATAPQQVAARIAGCAIVITNKVVLDAALLAAAPELRLICVAATGSNNIDIAAARAHGIAVSNVTGYATPSVAEHVFALLLSLSRRLFEYRVAVDAGLWQQSRHFSLLEYPMRELAGRTLAIIGHGELGHAVARRAAAFDMDVLIAARRGRPAPPGRVAFDEVLARCDVLSLHCPLNDDTRGLIGERELALMKPDAILVNTARGGIVDEAALLEALQQDRLGGAAVDVLSVEPPVAGNPLLAVSLPNLVVTPHIAWASREARQRLVAEIVANIIAFHRGEARNRVDSDA